MSKKITTWGQKVRRSLPQPRSRSPGSYSTPVLLVRLAPPDGSSFVGIVLQVPVAKCGLNSHPGWVSPGGSVMSEPVQRVRSISPSLVGGNKPPICFLCYGPGHFLAECPRLPAVLQKEAADNREAFQKNRPLGVVPLRALLGLRPWRPRSDREKWDSQSPWRAAWLWYMPLI
jgi:hypothetical protein